jgi:thiamine biosynthesis protein ThiS
MQIVFNGEAFSLAESCSLTELLDRNELLKDKSSDQYVVAVNQNFVHKQDYHETFLQDGDLIEVLGAVVGG